jgi:anti-sigma regulatory factor (Ser/Thr protein kinase)
MKKLRVPGVIDQVRVACDFVTQIAHDAGMDDNFIFQCELSVDEVCTNIIEHGYHHNGAEKSIEVIVENFPEFWRITITDEAPRFNPLEQEDPDPGKTLWERDNGGWGIYFVKQYMNTMAYRFENGRNCLILEKRLSA